MMKTIKGDLIKMAIEGRFDVIIHGCNCFCAMGAGLAAQIREEFPMAHVSDDMTNRGDKDKLGTYSSALEIKGDNKIIVVNAYTQYFSGAPSTQYFSGRRGVIADYDAIEKVFCQVKRDFPGMRIGIPKIGAGLAGGDWLFIKNIIEESIYGENITVVEYEGYNAS